MTARDGAELMLSLLKKHGELRQDDAANQLQMKFGDAATYYNSSGNLAIKAEVLSQFRKLTPDVVWLKSSRYWRTRQAGDEPGREQPY